MGGTGRATLPRRPVLGDKRVLSTVAILLFYVLAGTLIFRATKAAFLSQFPYFYSYIMFMLASGATLLVLYYTRVAYYATAFWFRFLVSLLVEFAVLVEISEHIFNPYPAIRRLGRVLTIFVGLIFFSAYVLPMFFQTQPADLALIDLSKRISLTKVAIIIVLLAAAKYYRLPLGKNVSGMTLGFALYTAVGIASFSAAQHFGKFLYASTLNLLFLLSYDLCLLVWTLALWRYELVLPIGERALDGEEDLSRLRDELRRFNNTLTKLLQR